MSNDSLDVPILKGNDTLSKKPAVLPYFQATTKSNSTQNEKWRKFFDISFIFCILISFIISIFQIHKKDSYDMHYTNTCSTLLNYGHWVSSPAKNNSHWQPETCVLKRYNYDLESIHTCLENTNINFVGDITISRLYQHLENVIFGSFTSNEDIKKKNTTERIKDTTKLVYHQDNYFDSKYFDKLLAENDPNIRNIFILSSGKTIINNYISETDEINEEELNQSKNKWSKKYLEALVKIQRTDHEFFLRLLTPYFNVNKDKPLAKKLVEWNNYIIQVTEDIRGKDINGKGNIHVPLSWNKLYFDPISKYDDDERDDFIKSIVKEELNLLLNSICNEKINTEDSTCCVNYREFDIKQIIIFTLLFIFGPLSLCYRKIIQKYYLLPPIINKFIPDDDLVINLTIIAVTVFFSYLTDHTAVFLKANKQYSLLKYLTLLILISMPVINSIETSKNSSILNSEQVNELQGLTLILYLLIQYNSDIDGNISTNISRVLVSTYMFLIGYTNYDYYYRKGNYEIVNFVFLILKKITLPLILAYALNGSLMDYFFPIMNIFWSIIIYSTMGILASYNNKRKFFLIKLGSSIAITFFIFVLLPFISKYIFLLLSFLFGVEWNYLQWNEYISMDFWTVWIGVGFSYLINNINEAVDGLAIHKFKISTLNIIGVAASIGGTVFMIPLLLLINKNTYSSIHPWVSFVLPISCIIFRNSNHIMRKRISKFLCWIGSFSMEIYVLYNHFLISSGSNNHGIIVYIPNSYWCNLLVSCVILSWISFTLANTINGLCRWMISSFFNISLSSLNNSYNPINNNSTATVHYDITGSINFNTTGSINNINGGEPSTSDVQQNSNEENKESNLDNILNNSSQENLTLVQDPYKETLKSIQYRWFGLFILLWVINIL